MDEYVAKLIIMYENAVDADKDLAADHLRERLMQLGYVQENGEWVQDEEVYSK